jgi:hypothetical protein
LACLGALPQFPTPLVIRDTTRRYVPPGAAASVTLGGSGVPGRSPGARQSGRGSLRQPPSN